MEEIIHQEMCYIPEIKENRKHEGDATTESFKEQQRSPKSTLLTSERRPLNRLFQLAYRLEQPLFALCA